MWSDSFETAHLNLMDI